ncbi:hypothetical protein GGX14DRAFT_403308 [Mycena pura]|uniref:Uncharacterized protein n=1 Tax=Mycena pura TaxID=153505 RepID=A0AAD6V3B1_9AGAR|nr:hypothetical protein GGX14DRAFT_403308 [Mycena pura]
MQDICPVCSDQLLGFGTAYFTAPASCTFSELCINQLLGFGTAYFTAPASCTFSELCINQLLGFGTAYFTAPISCIFSERAGYMPGMQRPATGLRIYARIYAQYAATSYWALV